MNSLFQRAARQRDCHRQHVSGVWSINAEDFCKETGIANLYDDALEYQRDKELDDYDNYVRGQILHHEKALGELTEEQIDNLRDNLGDETSSDDGYSFYFWDFVTRKLEA